MEPLSLILVGIVLFLSSVAQSAIGFGYAVYSTPLLLLLGLPLPQVIALVATGSLVQSSIGLISLRADAPWRDICIACVVRLFAIMAGIFVLTRFVTLDHNIINASIGTGVCLIVIIQVASRPVPKKRVHGAWSALAFVSSGFLAGLCGMGGPALVLWLAAHDWSTRKSRSFLFGNFACTIPIQLAILSVAFGPDILRAAAIGLAYAPLVYAGTRIGLPLGNRLTNTTLRTISYAVLFLIGLSTLISSTR
tara:strand:+ start:1354 stop:2103 length:750 start_codon:yes stop_codon:yes gene_type:complete